MRLMSVTVFLFTTNLRRNDVETLMVLHGLVGLIFLDTVTFVS